MNQNSIRKSYRLGLKTLITGALLAVAIFPAAAPTQAEGEPPPDQLPICGNIHVVQAGQTLSQIADQYGVEVVELAEANGLSLDAALVANQLLCVPGVWHGNVFIVQPDYYKLSVSIYKHCKITVSGKQFPKGHRYHVKLRPAGTLLPWIIVGTLSVKSDGTFKATYNLPDALKKAPRIRVCLKETTRGYLVCKNVNN